jgi:hypothetical protein
MPRSRPRSGGRAIIRIEGGRVNRFVSGKTHGSDSVAESERHIAVSKNRA